MRPESDTVLLVAAVTKASGTPVWPSRLALDAAVFSIPRQHLAEGPLKRLPLCLTKCGPVSQKSVLYMQDCGHACSAKCHHPKPPPVPEYTAPPPAMAPGIQLVRARKATAAAQPPALQVQTSTLPSCDSVQCLKFSNGDSCSDPLIDAT